MRHDAPYFIILLRLTPDDFTRQGESAATQWVNTVVIRLCGNLNEKLA
jgi:hypothetical protein